MKYKGVVHDFCVFIRKFIILYIKDKPIYIDFTFAIIIKKIMR